MPVYLAGDRFGCNSHLCPPTRYGITPADSGGRKEPVNAEKISHIDRSQQDAPARTPLHAKLVAAAKRNKQSINAELVSRLERSFEKEEARSILDETREKSRSVLDETQAAAQKLLLQITNAVAEVKDKLRGKRGMRGSIRKRGKSSWRLIFDVPGDGKRKQRTVTVRGSYKDAQKELTRLLGAADAGTLPDPTRQTVGEYLTAWLDSSVDSRRRHWSGISELAA